MTTLQVANDQLHLGTASNPRDLHDALASHWSSQNMHSPRLKQVGCTVCQMLQEPFVDNSLTRLLT